MSQPQNINKRRSLGCTTTCRFLGVLLALVLLVQPAATTIPGHPYTRGQHRYDYQSKTFSRVNTIRNTFFIFANTTPGATFNSAMMLCALESASSLAAQQDMSVTVLATYPQHWQQAVAETGLGHLPLKFDTLDNANLLKDTPLETWYTSGTWLKHEFPYHDLVNAVRLAVIYKYGGMYLDSDVILSNYKIFEMGTFLAKQDESTVNAHMFRFPPGHPFVWRWMERWLEFCTPDHETAQCGPIIVTAVHGELCPGGAVDSTTCAKALAAEATTPVDWRDIVEIADPNSAAMYLSTKNTSLATHWYHTPLMKWSDRFCVFETSYLDALFPDACPLTLLKNYDALICKDHQFRPRPAGLKDIAGYRKQLLAEFGHERGTGM